MNRKPEREIVVGHEPIWLDIWGIVLDILATRTLTVVLLVVNSVLSALLWLATTAPK